MFEFLAIWYASGNGFIVEHINFISHVLAAAFLVLTESTISQRVVTPMMSWIEDTFFNKIILLPSIISTLFFITWATLGIVLYQFIIKYIITTYQSKAILISIALFCLIGFLVNVKYRD